MNSRLPVRRKRSKMLMPVSLRAELHRHHPRQALANLVGVQARQVARGEVHPEDREFAGALAGAEDVTAIWVDLKRTRRLLRRRLAQRRELAGLVDREAGQAVVAAVGDP